MLETNIKLCLTEWDFPEKNLHPKLGKWTKNGPETGFFKFFEIFSHYFLLNLFYIEYLYYVLCSCINPIFGNIFVLEIKAKMFSANWIAEFFNQPYLHNKLVK